MPVIGYHASHEQFAPSDLLQTVKHAQAAGFRAAMCSDHFFPWTDHQGNSGHAWSWLGAALQGTQLTFGTVTAPGQRYHPAITAQAAATLAEMFPGRFWVAVGSGQFLNEHITGEGWPRKADRNERLLECVEVMRALWAGETVTHYGHVTVEDACLYSLPAEPPMIVAAAITAETAAWAAEWSDALITVSRPVEELREVVAAFRENGGAGKPLFLQVQLSYAPSHDEALEAAHREWGSNVFASPVLAQLRMPADFEAALEFVTPDEVAEKVLVSHEVERHRDWLHEYAELGFDTLYLHNVHRDQRRFLDDFASVILPSFA